MTIDLTLLPRRTLAPGQRLYRIHRTGRSPWYFSGDGAGRFDPAGSPGRGSCYFAEDPMGGWVESFRTVMTIDERDIVRRALCTVEADRHLTVVDLADRGALRAGVTAAMTSGAGYADAQALADALQGVVDGIRWRVRHDLEQSLIGIALFGPSGEPLDSWLPARTEPMPAALVRAAEDEFGYRVAPVP